MSVGVVIPVKDELHYTKRVVKQCAADPSVVRTVVIDNGSTDWTLGWLANRPEVDVIEMPGVGIHEMWNRGVDEVIGDVTSVAILNNDLDLGPGALAECDEVLQKLPRLAAVCPNYDGRTGKPRTVVPTTEICAGRYDGTGGLAGFAMVVAADFLAGYRFPEDCRWWYGDNDLVASIAEAGRQCGIVIDATVEHLDGGGRTGNWMSPEMREITSRDREVFLAKWSNRA